MTIRTETLTDGSIATELNNCNDWDEFYAANAEAILEQYGTRDKAFDALRRHGLLLGGGAAPSVGVTFAHLTPCKFTFDGEGPEWDGFAHGSRWNGFDNVAVTKETLDEIKMHFREEGTEDFDEIEPLDNGLYSLGWGFTTVISETEMAQEDRRQIAEQFEGPIDRADKPWRTAVPHVLYASDGEQTTILPLADLISNFNENGGWHDRCNAEDMRDEIFGRGWYEGTHECGRYIVVSVDKIKGASNLSHYFGRG